MHNHGSSYLWYILTVGECELKRCRQTQKQQRPHFLRRRVVVRSLPLYIELRYWHRIVRIIHTGLHCSAHVVCCLFHSKLLRKATFTRNAPCTFICLLHALYEFVTAESTFTKAIQSRFSEKPGDEVKTY